MTRSAAFASISILFLLTAAAYSQVVGSWGYSPYGVYNGGHASTAAEGYANGMGNIIQSAGAYNLQTSQAAINLEQARSQNLDNNLKTVNTYWAMRQAGDAARQQENSRFPGLTSEDSWRYAQMNMPKRLTPSELDPVTGKIYWPSMFQDSRYQDCRKQLDQLFVQRETSHGSLGYDSYMQVQQVADALIALLKKNIDSYQPGDYIRMKNFVESLAYEAKLPAV